MKEKILEIIRNVLEDNTIDENCSEATCEKWDSMVQLRLAVELENLFGVNLEPEQIAEMKSVSDICRIIEKIR